jgi:hypothetical protein
MANGYDALLREKSVLRSCKGENLVSVGRTAFSFYAQAPTADPGGKY